MFTDYWALVQKYYLPEEITPEMHNRPIRIVGGPLDGYEGTLLTTRGSKVKRLLVEIPQCHNDSWGTEGLLKAYGRLQRKKEAVITRPEATGEPGPILSQNSKTSEDGTSACDFKTNSLDLGCASFNDSSLTDKVGLVKLNEKS